MAAAIRHIDQDRESNPDRANHPSGVVSQDHHHQEEQHPQEAERAQEGKPDRPAAKPQLDVEGHLVRSRRVRIVEPQDEQGDEDQ